jgi:hypothetical protein
MQHDHTEPTPPLAAFRAEFARLQDTHGEESEAYEGAWDAVIAQLATEGRRAAADFTASPHWHGSPFTEEQLDQFHAVSVAMIRAARMEGERAHRKAVAAGVPYGAAMEALVERAVQGEIDRWMSGGRCLTETRRESHGKGNFVATPDLRGHSSGAA